MYYELTGGTCSAKADGPCTATSCPGYLGQDTETPKLKDCAGTGVGVSHLAFFWRDASDGISVDICQAIITFCP
jgi:hypothetical protein